MATRRKSKKQNSEIVHTIWATASGFFLFIIAFTFYFITTMPPTTVALLYGILITITFLIIVSAITMFSIVVIRTIFGERSKPEKKSEPKQLPQPMYMVLPQQMIEQKPQKNMVNSYAPYAVEDDDDEEIDFRIIDN